MALLAFGPLSYPTELLLALLLLAVFEARQRIHGEASDRIKLAVVLVFTLLLAID